MEVRMEIASVSELILELTSLRGLRDLKKTPGLTTVVVDEQWVVKINPHEDTIDNIPIFHFGIFFNGWVAGILPVVGEGEMAAGAEANEDTLIEALKAAIAKEGG